MLKSHMLDARTLLHEKSNAHLFSGEEGCSRYDPFQDAGSSQSRVRATGAPKIHTALLGDSPECVNYLLTSSQHLQEAEAKWSELSRLERGGWLRGFIQSAFSFSGHHHDSEKEERKYSLAPPQHLII